MTKFDTLEYKTVILAAFLHDIGKLLGRGKFKILDKGQHPYYSALFVNANKQVFSDLVDVPLLHELVQKHHENAKAFAPEFLVQSITDPHTRSLASLISLADNLSSTERGEAADKYQDYRTTPLCSVMKRVKQTSDKSKLSFHPRQLTSAYGNEIGEIIFPANFNDYTENELNSLIESFGKAFSTLTKRIASNSSFELLVQHLDNLVYSHTWCVPSNTQESMPDISLCDHLKTTAAIAAALYQYHAEKTSLNELTIKKTAIHRFILLSGDISGIQKYIFSIANSTEGGVAKRLRARSLFVQLCSDVATHKIIRKLSLPPWNVLMNSGGNFLILLPNTDTALNAINTMQQEIDSWFMKTLNGELALNLAHCTLGNDGFKAGDHTAQGFGHIVHKVKDMLAVKKMNGFDSVIQHNGEWLTNNFTLPVNFSGEGACICCGKFPRLGKGEDQNICLDCNRHGIAGALLPKSKYLAFYDSEDKGIYNIAGVSVDILSEPHFSEDPYLVIRLNDPDLIDAAAHPAAFRYAAIHVPRKNGNVATFEDIAAQSQGQSLLGFLKADVDRLGEAFVYGLKRETRSIDTMSRQATLSRMLDLFFTGYTEHLISKSYPDLYTVFSGGDDIFYVGPWDKILDVAECLNRDFARFTDNDAFTLSAGIYIAKSSYPAARAAEAADEALIKSKSAGRNRITLLGKTLTWQQWAEIRHEWEKINNISNNETSIPSVLLYDMIEFSKMWGDYRDHGNIRGLKVFPLLAYQLRRNIDISRTPQLYNWVEALLKWPPDAHRMLLLDNLGLLAQLSLFNSRGGK